MAVYGLAGWFHPGQVRRVSGLTDKVERQGGTPQALKTGAVLSLAAGLTLFGSAAYQVAIAAIFGTGNSIAVYLGIFAFPSLLVGGVTQVFNVSVLPVLVDIEAATGGTNGHQYAATSRTCITSATLALALLGGFGVLGAHLVVRAALPGLDSADVSYGTTLFRVTLVGLVLQGIAQMFGALFNARGQYFPPAMSGLIYLAVNFTVLVVLHAELGATSVPLGTLLGGVAMAAYMVTMAASRLGYRPALDLRDAGVRTIARSALPLMLTVYIRNAQPTIERYFSSQISLSALAYLAYADRLVTYFTTFTASGFAVTFFTLSAKYAARQAWNEAARATVQAIRVLLALSIPAAMAVVFLRTPILGLLLQRGAFDVSSVTGVGNALLGYLAVLILSGVGSIVNQVFYVRRHTGIVALIYLLQPIAYLLAAPVLMKVGSFTGLAAASSVAWLATSAAFYVAAGRRAPELLSPRLGTYVIRLTAGSSAAAALASLLVAVSPVTHAWQAGTLALTLYMAICAVILGPVLRLAEVAYVTSRLHARLGRVVAALYAPRR